MKYKHFFVCPQCDEISSFTSYEKINSSATFETSCSCGIMTHVFLKVKSFRRHQDAYQ